MVLVNGYTASASEITSGAIQDSGVGTIMGTKTFGKGVVQTIYPLPDGSAVKITTARYLTPRNRDINHLGITPDVVIGENKHPQYGTPTKDDQLEHALEYLTRSSLSSASKTASRGSSDLAQLVVNSGLVNPDCASRTGDPRVTTRYVLRTTRPTSGSR